MIKIGKYTKLESILVDARVWRKQESGHWVDMRFSLVVMKYLELDDYNSIVDALNATGLYTLSW